MTWPTDLTRGSTNAFSPESMISRNLMDQALKTERDRIATLSRQASISDSDSDSDSDDEKTTPSRQKTVSIAQLVIGPVY